jgi:hypothetical protein
MVEGPTSAECFSVLNDAAHVAGNRTLGALNRGCKPLDD